MKKGAALRLRPFANCGCNGSERDFIIHVVPAGS